MTRPGVSAIALAAVLIAASPSKPKFYADDPIAIEPETQDASGAMRWSIDLFYDLLLNSFGRPGLPVGSRAGNVNTIDEVPDSSWFTNRIVGRPLGIEEVVRGPAAGDGPAAGQLTVTQQKTEGDTPGFTVRDSAGAVWFVTFDPKKNPEAGSAAAVVANRVFWALGYNVADYRISELSREQIQIDPKAEWKPPSGRVRPMTMHDLRPVFEKAARHANGSYRILASRLLPGKILGGFRYYGTRPDDPNDIVPHELRRELRALHVFAAWTNLVDVKALNTMDTLVQEENGRSRVRHWLLDVGSTFGMGANGPHDWTDGYEYFWEPGKTARRAYTLGFYLQPWQTVEYPNNRSIGRFEGDQFDPLAWKSRVRAVALAHAREDDDFWAARRVMAFSDEMIRALAKAGQYSDAAAEKLLADTLIKRRDKIGQVYFARVNPLVDFSLDSTGTLRFENAAAPANLAYKAFWFVFDNGAGSYTPIAETAGAAGRIAAPAGLPQAPGTYVVADVRAVDAPHRSWEKPVRVTFRRTEGGWKLVGVERMPSETAQGV